MSLIAWIFMGLVAGFIASKIVDHHGKGVIRDVILGVAGALVGGFLFPLAGASGITGFNPWSVFVSTVGAIVVLTIAHLLAARRPA